MRQVEPRVRRVVEQLRAGSNVALLGTPGMGKSHHLARIASLLAEQGVAFNRVDLQKCDSGVRAMAEVLGVAHRGTSSFAEAEALFERGTGGESRTVLIDEFDAVTRFSDGVVFLRHLREFTQYGLARGLVVLLATRRPLKMIEEEVAGISTLDGVFDPHHIRPLTMDDVLESWPALVDTPVAAQALLEWSGGVPCLARRYLEEVVARGFDPRAIDYERLAWVARAVEYFDRIGLGPTLQQYILGPIVEERPLEHARLLAMGVLADDRSEAGDRFTALSEYAPFEREVRRRSSGLDAWGARGRLEIAGRRLAVDFLAHLDDSHGRKVERARDLLERGRALARSEGIPRPTLREAVDRLEEGDVWAAMEAAWGSSPVRLAPDDPMFWRRRLVCVGGLGRMRGERRSVDSGECEQFAAEISRQTDSLETRRVQGDGGSPLSVDSMNVTVRGGAIFGDVNGPAAVSGGKVGASADSGGRRWRVVLGVLSALAAVATVVGVVLNGSG